MRYVRQESHLGNYGFSRYAVFEGELFYGEVFAFRRGKRERWMAQLPTGALQGWVTEQRTRKAAAKMLKLANLSGSVER